MIPRRPNLPPTILEALSRCTTEDLRRICAQSTDGPIRLRQSQLSREDAKAELIWRSSCAAWRLWISVLLVGVILIATMSYLMSD